MMEYVHSIQTKAPASVIDALVRKTLVARNCLLVRAADQGMSLMVAGALRAVNIDAQKNSRRQEYWSVYVTIANQQFELADGDVLRIYDEGENYDVFMLSIGNVGRFSVTNSDIDTSGMLDLGRRS